MNSRGMGPSALVLAVLAIAPGCRRDDVTHTRIVTVPAPAAPATGAPPAAAPLAAGGGGPMAGMAGEVPAPPRPTGANALKWSLPKGWTDAGGGGMRYATLQAPAQGKLDISVVMLPGTAGGELPNVNRWRGQIGLPPVDEAGLAAARKAVSSKAGTVSLYDFESEGQKKTRMIAGLLTTPTGDTWFLKMVGDSGPVAAERAHFLHFLETLRFD